MKWFQWKIEYQIRIKIDGSPLAFKILAFLSELKGTKRGLILAIRASLFFKGAWTNGRSARLRDRYLKLQNDEFCGLSISPVDCYVLEMLKVLPRS